MNTVMLQGHILENDFFHMAAQLLAFTFQDAF